jgi:hypothetical protein
VREDAQRTGASNERSGPGTPPVHHQLARAPQKMARGTAAVAACVLALAPGAVAQQLNVQHVSIVTTQMGTSKAGYETFQVGVQFDSGLVQDVYALFGEPGANMVIPPAFQVAAPFGTDVGPVRKPLQL